MYFFLQNSGLIVTYLFLFIQLSFFCFSISFPKLFFPLTQMVICHISDINAVSKNIGYSIEHPLYFFSGMLLRFTVCMPWVSFLLNVMVLPRNFTWKKLCIYHNSKIINKDENENVCSRVKSWNKKALMSNVLAAKTKVVFIKLT